MLTITHHFTVVGLELADLDNMAKRLTREIDALPTGTPPDKLLAATLLNKQAGFQAFLEVVRGNEDPHTHPDGDLVIYVLGGAGEVHLADGKTIDAPAGSIVVIPKGVCHAFYNLASDDTIILATFSPINSRGKCHLS